MNIVIAIKIIPEILVCDFHIPNGCTIFKNPIRCCVNYFITRYCEGMRFDS